MIEVYKRRRMAELIEKIRNCSDEVECARILEERGRMCISAVWIEKAKDAARAAANDEEFLDNLGKVYYFLKREPGKVYVVYPQCYCHELKGFAGDVPQSYCNCSIGWTKQMFEQALGRSIEVKLESSIIRGDSECRLRAII